MLFFDYLVMLLMHSSVYVLTKLSISILAYVLNLSKYIY